MLDQVSNQVSDHPPLKRQRTDDAQKDVETRRSRFWFDDGNVILQAETTQFRVHRSLLSLHSRVFNDIFSMPQPTETTTVPNLDGCPVVVLEDKPSDLEHVLSIFYENIRGHDMRKAMPFDLLASILRLGKKYEIDYLCEEGLKRLRLEFPKTLKQWNKSHKEYSCIKLNRMEDLLQLCYELSIPSCLPVIHMSIVTAYTLDDIMSMSTDNGGILDRQIVDHSLRGRDKLIQAYHGIFEGWTKNKLLTSGHQCSSSSKSACILNKLLASQSICLARDGEIQDLSPWDTSESHVCKSCLDLLVAAYDKAREELWGRLPSFFGLPPWEELKDFDLSFNTSDS